VWVLPSVGTHPIGSGIKGTAGAESEGFMKARTLSIPLTAIGMTFGVTACSPAATACTVRHHYAIVVFQNGGGSVGKTKVTQFRLNVKYGPYNTQRYIKRAHFKLRPVKGKRLPVVIKTYWVGRAASCHVDRIKTHQ
jgi:hypothetical protein